MWFNTYFRAHYNIMQKISIAIHGGAGTILKEHLTNELEAAYKAGLQEALEVGYQALDEGRSSLEAVQLAIISLEDNILFNAGKGAVFTNSGDHELDASIMDGKSLDAGAVAGVKNIKNPIALANLVMTHSGHVLLSGKGASDFAVQQGMKLEADEYFYSKFREDQWHEIRDSDSYQLDHKSENDKGEVRESKFGTVGAVACDKFGNIAAGTSTGGMTNKRFGRIGDSPLIGSGTYANNKTCAISCTGHGEIFIRAVVAYDVSCQMEYKGLSLEDACKDVVLVKLVKMHGEGGLIGMDADGNEAMIFNSAGMYRGVKNSDGKNIVAIYND
ncbi:MAG: isoaspartyl peptidase/L-asparaginase [Ginsengibacter sp.]